MAIKLIHSNLKKHNRINLNLDFKMRVICETDPYQTIYLDNSKWVPRLLDLYFQTYGQ